MWAAADAARGLLAVAFAALLAQSEAVKWEGASLANGSANSSAGLGADTTMALDAVLGRLVGVLGRLGVLGRPGVDGRERTLAKADRTPPPFSFASVASSAPRVSTP